MLTSEEDQATDASGDAATRDLDEAGPGQRLFEPEPSAETSRDRRIVARLLGALAFVALAAGAINVIVDPVYRWHTGLIAPYKGEDRIKSYAIDHHVPVQTLMTGNSRALIVDPVEVSRRTGSKSYNAALSFTSWSDQVKIADAAIRKSPLEVRRIVWVLTPESMARRTKEGAGDFFDDVHTTFSLGELKSTAKSLAPRLGIAYHPNLLYTYDERTGKQTLTHPVTGWFDAGGAEAARRVRAFYTPELIRTWLDAVRDPAIRRGVEQAIARWSRRGVSTTVVLPPYQPLVYRLTEPRLTRTVAVLGAWVRTLQTRRLATAVDLSHIEAFSGMPNGFLDGVHLRGSNGDRLTSAVVAAARAL